jgi:hypothetical protein
MNSKVITLLMVVAAAFMLGGFVTAELTVQTASARILLPDHPTCGDNPGQDHGEPNHRCGGIRE